MSVTARRSFTELLEAAVRLIGRTWRTALVLGGALFAPAAWLLGICYARLLQTLSRMLSTGQLTASPWRILLLYAWLLAAAALFGLAHLFVRACLIQQTWHAECGRSPGLWEIAGWTLRRGLLRLIGQRLLLLAIYGAVVGFSLVLLGVAVAAMTAAGAPGVATAILASLPAAAAAALIAWLAVRFVVSREALLVETLGVEASLDVSTAVAKGRWWQLLGRTLLARLIVSFAASLLIVPIAGFCLLGKQAQMYRLLLSSGLQWKLHLYDALAGMGWRLGLAPYLGGVLSALVWPGFMTLLFLDLRSRGREAPGPGPGAEAEAVEGTPDDEPQ